MKKSTNDSTTKRLVISAMLIGLSVALGFVKLVDLPYGGSITMASLLPLMIIAYRYDLSWGFLCGLVYGIIKMFLGMSNFSYVTGAVSVVALALLDYLLAYGAISLSALSKRFTDNQPAAFFWGALIAGGARYLCHVISGATVWAGLSVPTLSALRYSLIYNATYMLPETLVMLIAGFYLATVLDFSAPRLSVYRGTHALMKSNTRRVFELVPLCLGLFIAAIAIYDISTIFSKLQDAESGEFTFRSIHSLPWEIIIIVSIIAFVISLVLLFVERSRRAGKDTQTRL